jgi:hypothetical protein
MPYCQIVSEKKKDSAKQILIKDKISTIAKVGLIYLAIDKAHFSEISALFTCLLP